MCKLSNTAVLGRSVFYLSDHFVHVYLLEYAYIIARVLESHLVWAVLRKFIFHTFNTIKLFETHASVYKS